MPETGSRWPSIAKSGGQRDACCFRGAFPGAFSRFAALAILLLIGLLGEAGGF